MASVVGKYRIKTSAPSFTSNWLPFTRRRAEFLVRSVVDVGA